MCKIILIVLYFVVLFEIKCLVQYRGLDIVPERCETVFINEKYVTNATINVRRYSRNSTYVYNVAGINKHAWANNASVNVLFFEFLHNEYKPSFIEIHQKMCDFINHDDFLGMQGRNQGLICPLPKGLWSIRNGSLTFPNFPYLFPFTKGKIEVIIKYIEFDEVLAHANFFVTFKQKKLKNWIN